jgi:hypothetical protein
MYVKGFLTLGPKVCLSFGANLILDSLFYTSKQVTAVFVLSDTYQCTLNRFDTNSDQIPNKKIDKLFVLFCNYSFPDWSNSAKN